MRVRHLNWWHTSGVALLGACLALGGCRAPSMQVGTATPVSTITTTVPPLVVHDETIASDYY